MLSIFIVLTLKQIWNYIEDNVLAGMSSCFIVQQLGNTFSILAIIQRRRFDETKPEWKIKGSSCIQ